ncbi:cytochrome c oxidase subunit 1 [Phlyctochytrium bullatum]|nr:cytochrome c oxidase subunit 1 [Phlyctochytrium bullatum]
MAMTILLDHTARSSIESPVAVSASSMVGKLYDKNGKEVRNFDENYHNDNTAKGASGDILTVAEILNAAGVDLSVTSQAPGAKPGETVRSAGAIISFLINYQNRQSGFKDINNVALKYKYFPTTVPRAEYKVNQNYFHPNGSVTELNRHGIFITFAQSGQIGEFSFIALLNNLVASLALLKVASIVVDLLMTKVLKERQIYTEAKIQVTEDIARRSEDPRPSMDSKHEDHIMAHRGPSTSANPPTLDLNWQRAN